MAGGNITASREKIRIRSWKENSLLQRQKIQLAHGRFAFRNRPSGKLLGVDIFRGNLVASQRRLRHWVLFHVDPIEDGFALNIPAYLMWIEVFPKQPYLTDRLQATCSRDCSIVIDISVYQTLRIGRFSRE
jgi:hypothetical protein